MDHFQHLHSYTNLYLPVNPPPPHPPPPSHEFVDTQQQQQQQRDRERLPQWSQLETSEFLSIRAELDNSFLTTKRNKALWEEIAARLRDEGFSRTPDQCKSKWKNLVTRFKGSEAMEQEAGKQQFPFYEEMRRIFSARAPTFDEKKKGKEPQGKQWDDEEDDEEAGEEEETAKIEERGTTSSRHNKKRKGGFGRKENVEAILRELMRRQMEMEERWMEAMEAREAERRAKEEEWRKAMVALGEERLALVRRWREREEERSARAEERAERRHQLITALLSKLDEEL